MTNSLNALITKLRFERNEIAKLEDSASEFSFEIQSTDKSMVEAVKQMERMRNGNREMVSHVPFFYELRFRFCYILGEALQ